jgi:hypothetical protein
MLAHCDDDDDVAHGVAVDDAVAFVNAAYVDDYGITIMTMMMMVLMRMPMTLCKC